MKKLPIAEQAIHELLAAPSTSAELRASIEMYLPIDTGRAREETETLESLFATRFFAAEEDRAACVNQINSEWKLSHKQMSAMAGRAALGARCEQATDRVLHLITALDRENVDVSMPPLTLIAVARAFVCKSVAAVGYDQGIENSRLILDSVIEDLTPMLRSIGNGVVS